MKMITAIVRTTSLESVMKSLADIGIKGTTIMKVKGIGEQVEVWQSPLKLIRINIKIKLK